jgi:hypothetical protein
MCFAIPNWDKEAIDQDDGGESVEESIGVKYFGKPASEHPDWKWVMMNETCSIRMAPPSRLLPARQFRHAHLQ